MILVCWPAGRWRAYSTPKPARCSSISEISWCGDNGSDTAGNRAFGSGAAIDYTATVLRWMDRHLRGVTSGSDSAEVRVFVMGANRWRESDRWPIPGTSPDTLYPVVPGRLQSSPAEGETVIRSDPADPVTDPYKGDYGAHDYRELPKLEGVVVFETAPSAEAWELVGQVAAELEVSATVPDFDLWLQLYDVAPDGTAWNLASPGTGLLRASYREGGPTRKLLPPGERLRLRIEGPLTANRFLPGHRLRIALSGAFAPLFSTSSRIENMALSSTEIVRLKVRPWLLSQVSVTGLSEVRTWLSAVQTVLAFGSATVAPGPATQPKSE